MCVALCVVCVYLYQLCNYALSSYPEGGLRERLGTIIKNQYKHISKYESYKTYEDM